nr:uncharacterized protein LOC117281887 isoform X1 [Nicotiana tomentosiformis]
MLRRKEKLAGNLFGKSCTFLARTKKRRKWRRRNRSCAFKEEKGFGIGSRSDFTECVDGCFSLWIGGKVCLIFHLFLLLLLCPLLLLLLGVLVCITSPFSQEAEFGMYSFLQPKLEVYDYGQRGLRILLREKEEREYNWRISCLNGRV